MHIYPLTNIAAWASIEQLPYVTRRQRNVEPAMNVSHANLLAITPAVREARLDWQACESARVERGYQWTEAAVNARRRVVELAREAGNKLLGETAVYQPPPPS
jgi:hypothetical protein